MLSKEECTDPAQVIVLQDYYLAKKLATLFRGIAFHKGFDTLLGPMSVDDNTPLPDHAQNPRSFRIGEQVGEAVTDQFGDGYRYVHAHGVKTEIHLGIPVVKRSARKEPYKIRDGSIC